MGCPTAVPGSRGDHCWAEQRCPVCTRRRRSTSLCRCVIALDGCILTANRHSQWPWQHVFNDKNTRHAGGGAFRNRIRLSNPAFPTADSLLDAARRTGRVGLLRCWHRRCVAHRHLLSIIEHKWLHGSLLEPLSACRCCGCSLSIAAALTAMFDEMIGSDNCPAHCRAVPVVCVAVI